MWELSDVRFEWMKKRIVDALEEVRKVKAEKAEFWANYLVGYLGEVLNATFDDLKGATPGNGLTDSDINQMAEEAEARR